MNALLFTLVPVVQAQQSPTALVPASRLIVPVAPADLSAQRRLRPNVEHRPLQNYSSMSVLRAAEFTFGVAAAADLASSWGRNELNPVIGRGQFGARQGAAMTAIGAGLVVVSESLGRKVPKLRKPLAVILFVGAGLHAGAAGWNMGNRR